jgi:hypothetical protein
MMHLSSMATVMGWGAPENFKEKRYVAIIKDIA